MAKRILIARRMPGNKEMDAIITLSSSIAHELKNYLAAINICAELSENKLKDISDICIELSQGGLKNIKQRKELERKYREEYERKLKNKNKK